MRPDGTTLTLEEDLFNGTVQPLTLEDSLDPTTDQAVLAFGQLHGLTVERLDETRLEVFVAHVDGTTIFIPVPKYAVHNFSQFEVQTNSNLEVVKNKSFSIQLSGVERKSSEIYHKFLRQRYENTKQIHLKWQKVVLYKYAPIFLALFLLMTIFLYYLGSTTYRLFASFVYMFLCGSLFLAILWFPWYKLSYKVSLKNSLQGHLPDNLQTIVQSALETFATRPDLKLKLVTRANWRPAKRSAPVASTPEHLAVLLVLESTSTAYILGRFRLEPYSATKTKKASR